MSKRLYREFYLLPRGEQRALILLSLLLILSLVFRMTVQLLPGREPEGMEEFEKEAGRIMASFSRADSLERLRRDSMEQARYASYGQGAAFSRGDVQLKRSPIVNINTADSVRLLTLPGIGPVFAGRIIKYRNLLGGFVNADQLAEVYGMPAGTIEIIRNLVTVDTSAIRKICIDSASFSQMLRHPYLELEDVKSLVNYRDFKGEIRSVAELKENHILSDSTLHRMKGYFDF